MERAESELQRLKLRIEGRPVPYYKVVNEFFEEKLGNFIEPNHTCSCNVCCLDIEAAKKKAVEDALSKFEESRRASEPARVESGQKVDGKDSGRPLIVNQQEH